MFFLVLALIIRFIQGLGDSFVSTAGMNLFPFLNIKYSYLAYSLVTIEFPDKREEYMGYCESAVGVGLMIGPVLGSFIFGLCGYEKTFYVFGTIIGIGLIVVFFLLPPRLNKNVMPSSVHDANREKNANADGSKKSLNVSRDHEEEEGRKPVTFVMILKNRRAMVAAVSSMFAMIFMLFYDSILSDRLKYSFGVGES